VSLEHRDCIKIISAVCNGMLPINIGWIEWMHRSNISLGNYKGVSVKPGDKVFLLTSFQTTLAHIIASQCKRDNQEARFVTMSATMSGVNDVKEAVKIAKNELRSFKRRTILFMDEIHRFNKLQQVLTNILATIFCILFLVYYFCFNCCVG
jgi:hypothetical protein